LLFGGGSLPDGGLENTLKQIGGAAGTANNIPNLIGIQKRYSWRELEPTKDNYVFTEILADLAKCKQYGKFLRVFLTFKGFNGGKGSPNYLRPGNEGYEAGFGTGVYNWPTGTTRNEHPCLWLPAVRDRFVKLFQMLGQAIDGGVGMPDTDARWYLSMVDINETSWGTLPGATLDERVSQQKEMCKAFRATYAQWKVAAPTTILTHFVNFPNNASFSVFNDTEVGLPAALMPLGFGLGGPDIWLDDWSLDGLPGQPGQLKHMANLAGLIPICPSCQEADFSADKHDHQVDGTVDYEVTVNGTTIQLLYDRATSPGTMYKGVFRSGIKSTHVNWAARTSNLADDSTVRTPPGNVVPWNLVRDFFIAKWNASGPNFHNKSPDVVTAVPTMLLDAAPPIPVGISVALATDTGELNNDKITSNPTLAVTGASVGATIEYATLAAGPWSTSPPAWVQGDNRVLVRQKVSGVPGEASEPLVFTYDTGKPSLVRTTVDGNLVRVTYSDTVYLSETDGFKPDKTSYTVNVNGTNVIIDGRFVSGNLKYIRLELRNPVVVTDVVKVSYTQPATGLLRVQDMAGNFADNFANVTCNNTTGLPNPTTTCTITEISGSPPGGYITSSTPLIKGTLSAPLNAYEEVEVRLKKIDEITGAPYYVILGSATVTGTNWQYQEGDRGDKTFTFVARVRNGEKLGAWSAEASITIDTEPPDAPTIDSIAVRENQPIVVAGTWGGDLTEAMVVTVAGVNYAIGTGVVLDPANSKKWSLSLAPKPVGRYAVAVRVTDLAGNETVNEFPGYIDVVPLPSINELRLYFAKRAT
jgi:hypothetical protein